MTQPGAALARAAEGFVGTPFQLGGRNPARGLDCVGLVAAALEETGHRVGPLPPYSLRQRDLVRFQVLAARLGLHRVVGDPQTGDIVLLRPAPSQWHLAIMLPGGAVVHAHAGLRRVTRSPAPLCWPVTQSWRLV